MQSQISKCLLFSFRMNLTNNVGFPSELLALVNVSRKMVITAIACVRPQLVELVILVRPQKRNLFLASAHLESYVSFISKIGTFWTYFKRFQKFQILGHTFRVEIQIYINKLILWSRNYNHSSCVGPRMLSLFIGDIFIYKHLNDLFYWTKNWKKSNTLRSAMILFKNGYWA